MNNNKVKIRPSDLSVGLGLVYSNNIDSPGRLKNKKEVKEEHRLVVSHLSLQLIFKSKDIFQIPEFAKKDVIIEWWVYPDGELMYEFLLTDENAQRKMQAFIFDQVKETVEKQMLRIENELRECLKELTGNIDPRIELDVLSKLKNAEFDIQYAAEKLTQSAVRKIFQFRNRYPKDSECAFTLAKKYFDSLDETDSDNYFL